MLFFIESGIMGLIGGVIGVIIGVGVSYLGTTLLNILLGVSTMPSFSPLFLVSMILGSFIIGSLAGVIPALRAAYQNPVEALRG